MQASQGLVNPLELEFTFDSCLLHFDSTFGAKLAQVVQGEREGAWIDGCMVGLEHNRGTATLTGCVSFVRSFVEWHIKWHSARPRQRR